MPNNALPSNIIIGLMSGTSMDGVDGVLAEFSNDQTIRLLSATHIPFTQSLLQQLMQLQIAGHDEIKREALAANELAHHYHACTTQLLIQANITHHQVNAIGAHGQTIRHCPALGFTRQTNNAALLSELTHIDVITDFRNHDIAAGGQGAPLVPAFHHATFNSTNEARVIVNIGGMSNITVLHNDTSKIIGFDTGPGNVFIDIWAKQHLNIAYDKDGAWAATGQIIPELLAHLSDEVYFNLPYPKSTGRDLFNRDWLTQKLSNFNHLRAQDIQMTLTALTAQCIAQAITSQAPQTQAIYVCGGGAYNSTLMNQLHTHLVMHNTSITVHSSKELGIDPEHVEALAFAWLANRFLNRQSGNLPSVTGARKEKILGALYPAS